MSTRIRRSHSNPLKIVQTGANTFEVDGNFTIRGVSKPEKLSLTVERNAQGDGGSIRDHGL